MRELIWMADGHQKTQWAHTATIQAQIINSNGGGKNKKAVDPMTLVPKSLYQREKKPKPPIVGIDALKVFVKK